MMTILLDSSQSRIVKCVVIGVTTAVSLLTVATWKKTRIVKKKANKKREIEHAEILTQLRNLADHDAKERNEILAMKPKDLIQAAQEGRIDPIKILQSYMYKACSDTQEFNSVACVIRECYKVASQLSDNAERGNLYGLPVSLKECYKIKGTDATIGVAKLIDINATEDCVLVKVLKHCGAVPFVKTNIVQLMMSYGDTNPIYGQTHNPHNKNLTPGGSSSGEGSLVGSGGSPLGFGTDTGGSIRVPSHMCGVCGLKPTRNRLSHKGWQNSELIVIRQTVGPIARDVDTLVVAMTALLCPKMFQLDPDVPPLPFNQEVFLSNSKLTIGYYDDDGYNKPIPAVQRALHLAKDALEKAGHKLVKFPVPDIEAVMRISTAAVFCDGGKGILDILSGDIVDSYGMGQYRKIKCPTVLRQILGFLLRFKFPRLSQDLYLHGGGDKSASRAVKLQGEANAYKMKFYKQWSQLNLDAIISPPFPMVAGEKGANGNVTGLMSYGILHTMLNYPAGVVPVSRVTEQDITALNDYKGHHNDPWDENIKNACRNSTGMPIGVQCVALPWREELCLRVMKEIETLVSYS